MGAPGRHLLQRAGRVAGFFFARARSPEASRNGRRCRVAVTGTLARPRRHNPMMSIAFVALRPRVAVGLIALLALLSAVWPNTGRAAEDFLEPEKAFQFSARAAGDRTVEVRFEVSPGYYMYRGGVK